MNQQLKLMIVMLVGVNIAIVGWLLLRPETGEGPQTNNQAAVLDDLLKDNTMEATRYDLSAESAKLNVIFIFDGRASFRSDRGQRQHRRPHPQP
jgi:hypothetical protein